MKKNIPNLEGVHTPKSQLGQSKMDTLVSAAELLFTKKGFYDTSISDICKEAHTAVGTFYIYFDTKTDVYKYIVEKYKQDIRQRLAESIANCTTRYEKEREGIRCFVKYALLSPTVYHIIWGSLSIDKEMFTDYYSSFAKSYTKGLLSSEDEINLSDLETVSYMLMGISSFLGLQSIFEKKSEAEIDEIIDNTVMPFLSNGIFRQVKENEQ